jgi:hypothetical protein
MFPEPRALRDTVQAFPPTNSAGPALFVIDIQRTGLLWWPRGSKQRDAQLRWVFHQDQNGMARGAISGISKKVSNVSWKINGPPSQVQYYQDVLGQAHFGHGWEYLQKLATTDFLTQSYGAIFEIAGPGDPLTPLLEAPTGLNHLDAGRCYVTGNPIYPLLYYSLWDGKLHKLHASRVYMMVDDPDPDERYFGIGTCALERAIGVVQREMLMGQYISAMLDDKPQPGLLSLTGVSDNNWQSLVAKYLAEQQNDDRPVFGRTLVMTSIDPNATVKAEVIPFAQTPEKFDFQKYTDLDVSALALALGIDRQELWELAGRGIGSGSQSAVLAMKSRAKFYGDWLTGTERFMNWAFLPDDCEFEYVEHDAQQDVTQTAIDLQLAQLAQTLAAVPGVTPLEIKKLLAARSDTFKDAMTDEMGRITVVSEDPKPAPQIDAGEPSVSGDTPVAAPSTDGRPPASAAPKLPSGQLVAQQTTKDLLTEYKFNPNHASDSGQFSEGGGGGTAGGPRERPASPAGKRESPKQVEHHGVKFEWRGEPVLSKVNDTKYNFGPDKGKVSKRTFYVGDSGGYDKPGGRMTYGQIKVEQFPGISDKWKIEDYKGNKLGEAQSLADAKKRALSIAHQIIGQPKHAQATKAFSATSADFQTRFTDIVTRAVNKQIRRNQAENLLLGLLLSSGTKAYVDGLNDGGVTDEITDTDNQEIQNLTADAIDYLDPFLDSIANGEIAVEDVSARAEMWSNKTLTDYYTAGKASADDNGMYEWVLGETDHCDDCQRLSGQRHRFGRWYETGWLPQGQKISCRGYRCRCKLVKTSAPAQGRF